MHFRLTRSEGLTPLSPWLQTWSRYGIGVLTGNHRVKRRGTDEGKGLKLRNVAVIAQNPRHAWFSDFFQLIRWELSRLSKQIIEESVSLLQTCKLVSWQRVFCVKNQQSCRSTFTRPMVSFFEIPRLFLYNLLHGCPLDFVLQESPTSPSCPIISCLLFINENKLFNLCSCK